jgi:membrane-bound lytic murein transglycosylase C
MVSYDDDLNSRSSVDFEKGEIEVEVIIEDTPGKTSQQSQEEGEIALEKKLQKVITLPAPDNQPILKDQIADGEGGSISPKTSKVFAKKVVATEAVQKSNITAKDGKPRVKYSVTIKMVPNHIEIRAKRFKANILKQSKRFKIDPAIVFAIIHTESSFNPKARSHVPAYGLMQLVPKSGARDAYSYIYKRDKLLSAQYLYIPVNNIELGCAYISKLRHVYFGGIKNDESAYYCTIAGYNTGPGNVAKTMSGTTKLIANANAVNGKTPEQIFKILSNKLPYVETRKYLVKVLERSNYYRSWLKM